MNLMNLNLKLLNDLFNNLIGYPIKNFFSDFREYDAFTEK